MYCSGTWRNRFAVLDPFPPPSNPLKEATPAPATPGQGKVSWATAAGPALALLQGNLAHAGPVATTVPAPASRTSAAREYTEADQVIGRVKRELHQAEGAKVVNHTALEMEHATMRRRAESRAQRRADLAAVRGKVAASNRAVRNAEGALSGATETYGQDHHAFVTKRGREINLNGLYSAHAHGAGGRPGYHDSRERPLTPLTGPSSGVRPGEPVVRAGRAPPTALRTEPTITDGRGRVVYDLAYPGLQDGHAGPAAVPSPEAVAAVLHPAAPLLPPTIPAFPPAAPCFWPPRRCSLLRLRCFPLLLRRSVVPRRHRRPSFHVPCHAVFMAFQAAEYQAAGQGGPSRGGPGSGGYTCGSDSRYGPGGGDGRL